MFFCIAARLLNTLQPQENTGHTEKTIKIPVVIGFFPTPIQLIQ